MLDFLEKLIAFLNRFMDIFMGEELFGNAAKENNE